MLSFLSTKIGYSSSSLEEMCLRSGGWWSLSLKVLFTAVFIIFIATCWTHAYYYELGSWVNTAISGLLYAFGQNHVILNSKTELTRSSNLHSSYLRKGIPAYFPEPREVAPWGGAELDGYEESTSGGDVATLPADFTLPEKKQNAETEAEAVATLHVALTMQRKGKAEKAQKLFDHALALAPTHPDILTEYGLFRESHTRDVLYAEELYTRALIHNPWHKGALQHRRRTLPLVEEIDNKMMNVLDQKREFFHDIPKGSAALRRAMREAYFLHVYHTVAIEGNTMSYIQTRSILETHLAVAGKSVVEHNEIIGMDAALRYLNRSLIHRIGHITIGDIKEIHHRVLGFVDPLAAGKFRETQVFVGSFTPVAADKIHAEMDEFIEWLNSDEALRIHPVELAALAHYKFVYIHPFVDGNGRTSRLLMNLILMQSGFPPVIIRVEDRLQYYETLKAANDGDLRPFIRFIALATERTLDSYIAAVKTTGDSSALQPKDTCIGGNSDDGVICG